MFGGVMERCSNVPTVVVAKRQPGSDGQQGSMSLCHDCFTVFKMRGGDYTEDPIIPEHPHVFGLLRDEGAKAIVIVLSDTTVGDTRTVRVRCIKRLKRGPRNLSLPATKPFELSGNVKAVAYWPWNLTTITKEEACQALSSP